MLRIKIQNFVKTLTVGSLFFAGSVFAQPCELDVAQSYANQYVNNKNYEQAKEKIYEMLAISRKGNCPDTEGKKLAWAIKKMILIYGTIEQNADSTIHYCQMGIDKANSTSSNSYYYSQIGYYLELKEQKKEALLAYEKAIQNTPADQIESIVDNRRRIANIYYVFFQQSQNQEELIKAIEQIEKALEIKSDDEVLIAQKNGWQNLLDPTELVKKLEEQLVKEPDNLQIKKELVNFYRQQNEDKKARTLLNDILIAEPSNIPFLEYRARMSLNDSRYQEALRDFKAINSAAPENGNAPFEIARIYQDFLQDKSQARTWAWKVINSNNQADRGYFLLGQIFESLAQECVNSKGGFSKLDLSDRLAYHIAYACYQKAGRSGSGKAKSLTEVIVTKSEKFMDAKTNFPKAACYSWIDSSWPEIKWMQEDWEKI
ncbi:hypothetical protein IT568_10100 [bacterium]|nr:hypothetical protein [bacterium]